MLCQPGMDVTRQPEADLLKTQQHLVDKTDSKEQVEGIIQALNPRLNESGRELKCEFNKDLTENGKCADVVFTEGHVHCVFGCLS